MPAVYVEVSHRAPMPNLKPTSWVNVRTERLIGKQSTISDGEHLLLLKLGSVNLPSLANHFGNSAGAASVQVTPEVMVGQVQRG